MSKMRAAQVVSAKGPYQVVEREIPEPDTGQVRIRVQASGICHSDSLVKEGLWPGIHYPRVPGHEVAGIVDAVGAGVAGWKVGERVGVGWHGGHCGYCDACRRGDFLVCRVAPLIPGISYDGGHADYMIAPAVALARIPEGLSAAEAAPLMCAGVTTFNSLRHAGARPGDLVAVLGLGGLGHLGVQFAAKAGHRTVAIARGKDKEPLARRLGAHHYIDSQSQDPARSSHGWAARACADVPLEVSALALIGGRRSISGWPSGRSIDSQDTMAFSALTGVRSINELFPLERAAEGYERMMSGKARFRVVLTTGQ
ncbi:MAG: alcohol dehydrogenase [Acidobacteria bacterium]|nr:MAG: alcohol dehydrogenase [Acidobacteriota bacterium]